MNEQLALLAERQWPKAEQSAGSMVMQWDSCNLMMYHICPDIRRFFPILALEKLGVVINSHTKENNPAELNVFVCHIVHTTIASVFLTQWAWFLVFAK